jgi:hypothetical protein
MASWKRAQQASAINSRHGRDPGAQAVVALLFASRASPSFAPQHSHSSPPGPLGTQRVGSAHISSDLAGPSHLNRQREDSQEMLLVRLLLISLHSRAKSMHRPQWPGRHPRRSTAMECRFHSRP